MPKTVLITGASSGFGELTAYQLADAGHVVYASMRGLSGRNAGRAEKARAYSAAHAVDIRTVELDVQDQASVCSGKWPAESEPGCIHTSVQRTR